MKNVIPILLIIMIAVIFYSGRQIEKAVREVGYALCQVERLKVEDSEIREVSKQAIATLICTPSLLGRFAK